MSIAAIVAELDKIATKLDALAVSLPPSNRSDDILDIKYRLIALSVDLEEHIGR